MKRVNIPVDLEWADDLAEMTGDRDEWRARAERAEAEAEALRAELDAARAGQVQARCCYCNKPATMARTYYDRGFPSAREHLCAEHFEHHPWHGDEEARP